MSGFNWDEHKTGEYVKFENIGDKIVGDIIAIKVGEDFNGNPVPQLTIRTDDGQERSVTAGQVLLKAALAEQGPQVGDKIFIQYSGNSEAKPGKAPAKQFKVAVQTGAGNVEPEAFSSQATRDKIQAATQGLTPTDDIPF